MLSDVVICDMKHDDICYVRETEVDRLPYEDARLHCQSKVSIRVHIT